ncbi:predicted protein [Botrytis cinerea T4]|uniref:Uncharacterized protein n=1 Tax=Botryotinia fuckeliana (strain T4) TaxID=999810 RepID=G2XVU0_BOTF4|nr:predicted protein [Botrytis cinerea T4]
MYRSPFSFYGYAWVIVDKHVDLTDTFLVLQHVRYKSAQKTRNEAYVLASQVQRKVIMEENNIPFIWPKAMLPRLFKSGGNFTSKFSIGDHERTLRNYRYLYDSDSDSDSDL